MSKRMKKSLAMVCVLAMLLTLMLSLSGCQKETGDPTSIVMTYMYGYNVYPDTDKVEAAFNARLKELGVNVTVDFLPLGAFEAAGKYQTIVGVEEIDLMCVAFADPLEYAELDMIQVLSDEDIKQYAPGIDAMNEEYPLKVTNAAGEIIGIATREDTIASGGSYVVSEEDLKACGLAEQYKDQQIIGLDDLRIIFAALKEQFPDSYPISSTADESYFSLAVDNLGSSLDKKSSGVLCFTDNGWDSTQVVNYYETQAYKDYIEFMRECREKGWISRDAAASTTNKGDDFKSGNARGVFLDCDPVLRDQYELLRNNGERCVQLHLTDIYYVPPRANTITWGVCGTSDKVAASLQVMNAIWTDSALMNMIYFGIEGEHYVMLNEEHGIIDFATNPETGEKYNQSTTPYYNGYGVYGDKRNFYVILSTTEGSSVENEIAKRIFNREVRESGKEHSSPADMFIYDPSKMSSQIKNVEAVLDEYAKVFALGDSTEAKYNEFIAKLKQAGIDEIIADKQAQLDAYLSSK